MQDKSASTMVVESMQETLIEQAKVQEENFQSSQDELKASMEKSLERRLSRFNQEMALLGTRVEEVATTAATSSDKINKEITAVRQSARELSGEVDKLQTLVQKNHTEFDSHVMSSRAFIKMAADQQASLGKTSTKLVKDIDHFKAENGDRMTSLERSNVSVVTTMRRLQRSLDALATKEGRWDRLEVQTKRHVQVLGGHLADLEGAATCAEPFSLGPAMQKHVSAVSQMVAKIVATRADYEVTRQAVNRKNPGEDSDWDRKVEELRIRFMNKFVSDVVQVASKLRPLPDRPVEEVRETFATKLELSMKLAISKYKPIQAGATILGKVHLLPSCMACDRPFIDNPGPGDPRSVVQDHRGERERSRERALERGGGSPSGGSRGQWNGGGRDRSPHKYVMRSGFKMRQSASEGGGLVAHPRAAGGGEESLEDILGGGKRLVFGNAHSSSVNLPRFLTCGGSRFRGHHRGGRGPRRGKEQRRQAECGRRPPGPDQRSGFRPEAFYRGFSGRCSPTRKRRRTYHLQRSRRSQGMGRGWHQRQQARWGAQRRSGRRGRVPRIPG
ncbi:myosin-like antigen [Ectocarpus siliculosus]|uniref:Myosin-like antigen n=1 Tax=Ectocarpus siliculosus TaxID=2880 RepID=D7G4P4_ECTSI|nr:myosin-like antigen [Ectocarpus siliculosus]|eukprot:CBJ33731.1 myosin-like antigen [Ectocarpus siliculosus]